MNRVIRPGVWLFFLFTGMSATALACPGKTDGAVGDHASIAVNRAAALFCYAAILGPGTHTEATSAIPDPGRFTITASDTFAPFLRSVAGISLGAAKRSHFGQLSARKE